MRWAVVAGTLGLAQPAGAADAGVAKTVVVLKGQAAAGFPGQTYSSLTPAGINDTGVIAVGAALTGSGPDEAVWADAPGTLVPIAAESWPAPDVPEGNTFWGVHTLRLNAAARVTFRGRIHWGNGVNSTNDWGLWSTAGSTGPRLLARTGYAAAGTAEGTVYAAFSSNVYLGAFGGGGETAFLAQLRGTGIDTTNDRGIWRGAPGGVGLLARTGSPAPGLPDGLTFSKLYDPVINAGGMTAFYADLGGPGVSDNNDGTLWACDGDAAVPRAIVRQGNAVPGLPDGYVFGDFFSTPAINDRGHMAFTASHSPASQLGSGLWLHDGAGLRLLAKAGDPVPGSDPGVVFGSFVVNGSSNTVLMGARDELGLVTALAGEGVSAANDTAVATGPPGGLRVTAREGRQAPGAPAGTVFNGFEPITPLLNARGQIAFVHSLTGSGVSYGNDTGLWATDAAGNLLLVAREGDSIELSPGIVKAIREISLPAGGSQQNGRASAFNARGQLIFLVECTDYTSEAVLVAQLPLPGDADANGLVDTADVRALYRHLGQVGGRADGDFNYDGLVDFADLQIVERFFGWTYDLPLAADPDGGDAPDAFAPQAPEPVGWAGMALALLVLPARRLANRQPRHRGAA